MQARTRKLAPVVKHVDKHEQTALQAVAYSQKQLQMQEEILAQLERYKSEYTERHFNSQQESFTVMQLQEFNRFLAQLDETIKQQQNVVNMAVRELEFKRDKWKEKRSRSQAMHKVVDRIQASEQQQALKVEQKIMDECALRLHLKDS